MGMYLNPGNSNFRIAANSEIFVDKSEMIRYINTLINTNQRYICVSRPRRFGKTMAADMLCAYYDCSIDSRELFCKKKVAGLTGWDKFLGAFNVIRIVMTDFIKAGLSVEEAIALMTKRILTDLAELYPQVSYDPDDLVYSTEKFYQTAGRQFVIIIDEWDAVFRIRKADHDGQQLFLDFLRGWLKDRSYVALAYMTGILPIKKYGQHSALNMFDEYSMTMPMQMAPYSGFTNEEVEDLCNRYGRNYENIRSWYDGYEVYDIIPPEAGVGADASAHEQQTYSLYSPLSVVKAVSTGIIQNYWNQTESYQALADYIDMNMDGLKDAIILMMQGERIKVDISGYQNDMTTFKNRDDVLALLIHLGYLGYDGRSGEVFIPNREIMDVFRTSTSGNEWAALS